jgi:hypothetical protein
MEMLGQEEEAVIWKCARFWKKMQDRRDLESKCVKRWIGSRDRTGRPRQGTYKALDVLKPVGLPVRALNSDQRRG